MLKALFAVVFASRACDWRLTPFEAEMEKARIVSGLYEATRQHDELIRDWERMLRVADEGLLVRTLQHLFDVMQDWKNRLAEWQEVYGN